MAVDPQCYKLFQLADVLIRKYAFRRYIFKRPQEVAIDDDIWLISENDEHYQLIRLTLKDYGPAYTSSVEFTRIHDFIVKQLGREIRFLNLFVSANHKIYDNYAYDNVIIDEDYISDESLYTIYPDLQSAIHQVDDYVQEIYHITSAMNAKPKADKKTSLISDYFVTLLLILICSIIYICENYLFQRYDHSAVYVFMGADYKTFTLGLRQFYRLFSCALVHGSFLHLLSNMYSLLFIGYYLEKREGHFRYLAIILVSVYLGSLTQNILDANAVLLGISGGLYGLLIYLFIDAYRKGALQLKNLLPLIIINLAINLMSSTAWMAHLGGAIGGMMMYLLFHEKYQAAPALFLFALLLFMTYRYVKIDVIEPFYTVTDMQIVRMYSELGNAKYADKLLIDLLLVYETFGG